MDEKQLFEAWKSYDKNEKRVYKLHKDEFLKLAKRKSNDIFAQIKMNMILEGILSILVGVFLPYIFLNNPIFFWIVVVLMLAALLIGFRVYGKYWKEMKQLNESSLVDSLEKKLAILSRYVKQLKVYLYLFMPIGFVVGFSFALKQEEIYLAKILILTGVSLPFLGLMIWLGKKYIYALYGKHLKRIEEIYNDMKENLSS